MGHFTEFRKLGICSSICGFEDPRYNYRLFINAFYIFTKSNAASRSVSVCVSVAAAVGKH